MDAPISFPGSMMLPLLGPFTIKPSKASSPGAKTVLAKCVTGSRTLQVNVSKFAADAALADSIRIAIIRQVFVVNLFI